MKCWRLHGILRFLIVFVWTSAGALADAVPVRVTGSRVNLRTGPGLNYEVVDQIEHGKLVLARSFQPDWVEVIPPSGTYGWVSAECVKGHLVMVDRLNIRSGPGINYSILGTLAENMVVVPKEKFGEKWLKIDMPSSCSLWVSFEFVELVSRVQKSPVPVEAPGGVEMNPQRLSVPRNISWTNQHATPVDNTIHAMAPPSVIEFPSSIHLVPLPGQGRLVEQTGVLRKTPRFARRPFKYRLVRDEGNHLKTLGFLHGNGVQLKEMLGREIRFQGLEYWIRGMVEPVWVPKEITPVKAH